MLESNLGYKLQEVTVTSYMSGNIQSVICNQSHVSCNLQLAYCLDKGIYYTGSRSAIEFRFPPGITTVRAAAIGLEQ